MSADSLARLAGLLADETRAAMCLALLDGRAWTAGELARHARVAPSTVTGHLDKLVHGGLVVQDRQGRHRYLRLAGPDAAGLVEMLSTHAGPATNPVRSLRTASASATLVAARTCYDHLAGRLGVAITEALMRRSLLDLHNGCALTDAGVGWFATSLGIDIDALRTSRRPVALSCIDWTERRPHLAGLAGAHLCATMMTRGWLTRVPGTRAVRVTAAGGAALHEMLGLEVRDGVAQTVGAA